MFIIALHFALLLRKDVFAVELCSLLHAESVPLQGLSIVGNRLQFIISNQVYTTELSVVNSGPHLSLIGVKSHGSYQSFGWMAIASSTFARTNVELVAAFELPTNNNLTFGHLIVRQLTTQKLDHRLVDLGEKQVFSHKLKYMLPNGLYGMVSNANQSLLFRVRDYGEKQKVVVFRQGPVIDASGYSAHLPVTGNEKAVQPFYYLHRDSQDRKLKIVEALYQTDDLPVLPFESLPLFGFIYQETAHVIDATTRTVIVMPLSAVQSSSSSSSNSSNGSVLREIKFEQYFVCVNASFQGDQTTILVVVGVGIVLVAALALLSIGKHRQKEQEKSSFSSSSASVPSETNQQRLEMMVAKMGLPLKNRPCFNPANYKVKGAKKKKAKKKDVKLPKVVELSK